MQCLLDAWRAELARKPLSMSEEDACKVLGITPQADGTISEDELKAAYRRCDLGIKFAKVCNPLVVVDGSTA